MENYDVVYEFLDEIDTSLMAKNVNHGRWINILREFLLSDKKYCLISFKNENELNSCRWAIQSAKKKYDYQITVGRYKTGVTLYVAKP